MPADVEIPAPSRRFGSVAALWHWGQTCEVAISNLGYQKDQGWIDFGLQTEASSPPQLEPEALNASYTEDFDAGARDRFRAVPSTKLRIPCLLNSEGIGQSKVGMTMQRTARFAVHYWDDVTGPACIGELPQ